jgi:bifunctional non-homologous end joining protein LigD
MPLEKYHEKRDFSRTPEPKGSGKGGPKRTSRLRFVIQKHDATRLHYDFRLEMDGVLKSWAVPKGPSLDPGEKRLAVHVEDHPIEYGSFEGTIPEEQYGGGTVLLWDRGTWTPLENGAADYAAGKLKFELHGKKLSGLWMLVRMTGERGGDRGQNWLLIKERDAEARPGSGDAIVQEQAKSVASHKTIEEIATSSRRVWNSGRPAKNHAAPKIGGKAVAAKPMPPPGPSRRGSKAAKLKIDLSLLPKARKGPMPHLEEPELPTLVESPPQGDGWYCEIKYDGYRALCEVENGSVRMLTRHGKDWTARFAPIGRAALALPVTSALFDGEVVVLDERGMSSFQALQESLSDNRGSDLVYYVFDLIYLDGHDLRATPLSSRKEALKALFGGKASQGPLLWSDHVEGRVDDFFAQACSHQLEGIVVKRADRGYSGGRTRDWLKVKCLRRQEMVIGGYTAPGGTRSGFGALLVGVYEDGELHYAGRVGTGFSNRTLDTLAKRLARLKRQSPPFVDPPRGAEAKGAHWVTPELVAEVTFTEWTRDGVLRHPSFQGLREDKKATEVVREKAAGNPEEPPADRAVTSASAAAKTTKAKAAKPKTAKAKTAKAGTAKPPAVKKEAEPAPGVRKQPLGKGEIEMAGVKITHPNRILYPGPNLTKLDLARYYEGIADWILPLLGDRPLTLVRCPEGEGKETFYQKHLTNMFGPEVIRVDVEENTKRVDYGAVHSIPGLMALVQMSVCEIHIWGCHRDMVERPDYVVFDLDPDEGLEWKRVAEGARLMRGFLQELGLRTFLKTTGGKGLHVVLPIARRHEWPEIKAFCKAIADTVAQAEPARYTSQMPKVQRKGRIYIDYLRNTRGATSIAAYSTRSRPGAPVSVPLDWDELTDDRADTSYTVLTLPERLAKLREDPWADFAKVKQSLSGPLKQILGRSKG